MELPVAGSKSGLRIVALGDSITWGFPYGPSSSWVRRVADGLGCDILNLGENGATLADLRARLPEVIAFAPAACIVMGGTNDVSMGRQVAAMAGDLVAIVDGVKAAGIFPIIGMPIVFDEAHCEAELAAFRHLVNAYAGTRHLRVIHFDRLFRDAAGGIIPELFLDGVHPSLEGYAVMAAHVIGSGALNLPEAPRG